MNPEVETSFLPDSERDAELAKKREELKQQWREEQERVRGVCHRSAGPAGLVSPPRADTESPLHFLPLRLAQVSRWR